MFRTLLICAVVSASITACSSAGKPVLADAKAAQPCVVSSASRIPERSDQCSVTPGRAYTQQDIERTGQTNVGDALQMLDPSISVHH
jgi:outer membrane cobalamin receptor